MTASPDRNGLMPLVLGSIFLLASNLMGHGLGFAPDLRGALLLAAIGLLLFALAGRRSEWRAACLRVLQLMLALGAFSAVAAFIESDLQEFHWTAPQDWGATPPPQVMFATIYAVASLVALLGISVKARHRRSGGPAQMLITAD